MTAPTLITRESPDLAGWRRVICDMDRRLCSEAGFDLEIGTKWEEAWIWGGTAPDHRHYGFATFQGYKPVSLSRVWIERPHRRRGYLREAWPVWGDRYGDFEVFQPEPVLQIFLRTVGYGPAGPRWVSGVQTDTGCWIKL